MGEIIGKILKWGVGPSHGESREGGWMGSDVDGVRCGWAQTWLGSDMAGVRPGWDQMKGEKPLAASQLLREKVQTL